MGVAAGPMKRWRAPEHVAAGVLLLFGAIIVATAAVAWNNIAQLRQNDGWVTHSWQILNAIEQLLSTLKDAETGQRGYLITGDPAYLAPYEEAVRQVRQRQGNLLVLVTSNPEQLARAQRLQPLVTERLDEIREVLDLHRNDGAAAARNRILRGRGKATMDAVRGVAGEMLRAEQGMLGERTDAVQATTRYAQRATIAAAATGLILAIIAYLLYHREHVVNGLAFRALDNEKEQFRTTLASIGDGVVVTDVNGVVSFLNPVAQTLTGLNDDGLGRPVDEVFHIVNEETERPVVQPVREVMRHGVIAGLANHTVLVARDGTKRPIEDSAAPIREPSGALTGVVLVFRDASKQRQAHKQLEQSEAQLRVADVRKDEFLAMLAHELRNPLAPIRVSVQLLKQIDCADQPALEKARDIIERQSGLLSRLVDDLMDAASIRSGKAALDIATVNVSDVVARAMEQCQPLIEERHHQLHVALPEQPVCVRGDVHRLTQVLANLLANSAKYTPEDGEIWIDVAPAAHEVQIRVRDVGLGIAPEVLPLVFDLFVQSPEAQPRRAGGLGIGLALVKRLVELHGGAVTARSDGVGKGSEFVVTLPAI